MPRDSHVFSYATRGFPRMSSSYSGVNARRPASSAILSTDEVKRCPDSRFWSLTFPTRDIKLVPAANFFNFRLENIEYKFTLLLVETNHVTRFLPKSLDERLGRLRSHGGELSHQREVHHPFDERRQPTTALLRGVYHLKLPAGIQLLVEVEEIQCRRHHARGLRDEILKLQQKNVLSGETAVISPKLCRIARGLDHVVINVR